MAITTPPTTIPAIPATSAAPTIPSTQGWAFNIQFSTRITPAGLVASANITGQRIASNSDGTSPIPLGAPIVVPIANVAAASATDAALAALNTAVMTAIATYWTAKGH